MKLSRFALLSFMIVLSACGAPAPPPQALPPVAMAGAIAIFEPRVRLPPPGTGQTAAYFTMTNQGAVGDRLVSASSPMAETLELHAHMKSADGMMMMREITAIDVPARATIPLSPGGLHIMLKGVKAEIKVGDNVPIELAFASGMRTQVQMPVVANPVMAPATKDNAKSSHQH